MTAIIYPDSDTNLLVAECPELGTASQGSNEEEALDNLREATALYLESFPRALKKSAAIRTFELTQAMQLRHFKNLDFTLIDNEAAMSYLKR